MLKRDGVLGGIQTRNNNALDVAPLPLGYKHMCEEGKTLWHVELHEERPRTPSNKAFLPSVSLTGFEPVHTVFKTAASAVGLQARKFSRRPGAIRTLTD